MNKKEKEKNPNVLIFMLHANSIGWVDIRYEIKRVKTCHRQQILTWYLGLSTGCLVLCDWVVWLCGKELNGNLLDNKASVRRQWDTGLRLDPRPPEPACLKQGNKPGFYSGLNYSRCPWETLRSNALSMQHMCETQNTDTDTDTDDRLPFIAFKWVKKMILRC